MEQISPIAELLRPLSAVLLAGAANIIARWAAEGVHVAFLTCPGYASHRLSPRFIVHQESKDRPCDNCRISKLNKTYYSPEKRVLLRADFNAIIGKRFFEIASRENWLDLSIMGSGGDDEPDAYRNLPQDDFMMT